MPPDALPEKIAKAYGSWVNDAFWLNPLEKLFDPGVERAVVSMDGLQGLRVTFASNGLTPGDSYVFLVDERGLPSEWRMWTRIPIGGLPATWEGWETLATGARASTVHSMMGFDLKMENVAAADSLKNLLGAQANPFATCPALAAHL